LWHIGFRIHVEGRENLKKVQTKGCILAPTHVSAIDPVFIVVTRWGRRMIVFAKKELFDMVLPLLRRGVRARHKG
jgi:1-acyl-sn-glycerol-3-phosphate acyltransferase